MYKIFTPQLASHLAISQKTPHERNFYKKPMSLFKYKL